MGLPVVHALSGCDPTNALFGIGKKRWNTDVKKYPVLMEEIRELGDDPVNVSNTAKLAMAQIASFLYCGKLEKNVDGIRYALFTKKGFSCDKLPPTNCSQSAYQKCKLSMLHMEISNKTVPKLTIPIRGWLKQGR